MPTLKEILKKKNDPVGYMLQRMEDLTKEFEQKLEDKIIEAQKELAVEFDKKVKEIQEADPKYGALVDRAAQKAVSSLIDIAKGEPGKDYVPTEEDKQNLINQIFSLIEIPKPIPGEPGKTPIPGVDYPTKSQIHGIIIEEVSKINIPKQLSEEKIKELATSVQKRIDFSAQGIANELNKEKEIVEMDVIKGLKKFLGALRQKGGGGGGMGNVQTQSTAISSLTTTITLSNKVASGGRAIWFNYQGQQQAYGTHFTVLDNVVTLLFTPDDDTFADIIYIRR